jgi:curli biogenesis system outer membrane secretion channel CsgG
MIHMGFAYGKPARRHDQITLQVLVADARSACTLYNRAIAGGMAGYLAQRGVCPMNFTPARLTLALMAFATVAGCATESHRSVEATKPVSAGTKYNGPQSTLIVAKFNNRSTYLQGMFSDGVDRLGSQAKTVLIGHLQSSGRFAVMDRDNLQDLARESQLGGATQAIQGAQYALTGDVTEFGRKETGDQQLFGILGSGKKQTAYSKVTINVIDVRTSQVVYSVQGAGEYALSNREVVGFGGTAGYDSTLNGKVLDLAIREAVDRLVEGIEKGQWKPGK